MRRRTRSAIDLMSGALNAYATREGNIGWAYRYTLKSYINWKITYEGLDLMKLFKLDNPQVVVDIKASSGMPPFPGDATVTITQVAAACTCEDFGRKVFARKTKSSTSPFHPQCAHLPAALEMPDARTWLVGQLAAWADLVKETDTADEINQFPLTLFISGGVDVMVNLKPPAAGSTTGAWAIKAISSTALFGPLDCGLVTMPFTWGTIYKQVAQEVALNAIYAPCPKCAEPPVYDLDTNQGKARALRDGAYLLRTGMCQTCHTREAELVAF